MADEITKPGGALRPDVNGDGTVTIADLPGWAVEVFFLPGDWLVWAIRTHAAPVARFLELGADDYGGVLSGSFSGLCWLALLMLTVVVLRAVHNFDQALTTRLRRGYSTARLRLRVAARLLEARLRRPASSARGGPHETSEAIEFSEPVEVNDAELRVLKLHDELEAGYALAVGEVAAALELGTSRAGEILERLVELQLLGTTVGGCDGQTAYTLTRVGRAYLSFRRLG